MDDKTYGDEANNENPEPGSRLRFLKKRYTYLYIIAFLLVIIIAAYILLKDKFFGSPISPQMRQMQQVVNKVRNLEAVIQQNQGKIFSLMREYKEKTGKELPAMNLLNLSEEEERILANRIRNEQDVTKTLLSDIIENNSEIRELKVEIERLEKLLPAPRIVERGENHFQIAMDFLLNEKKIEKKRALELVERVLLFDPLIPGFKVWNFYFRGEYGTFITQGSAVISPNEVRRRSKRKLIDDRDRALGERNKLAQDISVLESRRGEIISQLDLLNLEKQKLISRISDLNKENLKMQETINSLFYLVDLKRNLKKRGIIKGGFLRSLKLRKVSPEFFNQSIDMRARDTIKILAADFGRKKIKKVLLYPKYYKKGIDYEVTVNLDRKAAELIILDTAKLKNERVVISVE
ncbi:MAG: hypothetical protein KAT34_09275 [Candidatus Aminicenantes bacterium]|nr:hypothetical protein [Candidatus Aminicenantes bacterium]